MASPKSKFSTRRALIGSGAAAALLAASGAGGLLAVPAARAQAPRKLAISYPTRSGASWPLWIAKNGGYYQKHGFEASLEFGVHPAGIATLVSGQAQMINYGIEQVLAAVVREPSMVMMGSTLNKGSFALVANASIAKTADLKGKRIGVGRLGDVLYIYTLEMLHKSGLGTRDVQWVSTGTDASARVSMLMGGQIDAFLVPAPAYFKLEAQGVRVLDLIANHADIFVSTALVFKKSWVAENKDAPLRLTMAHAEAIKRFYDDKAFAVETYRAFDPQDKALVERLYDIYVGKDILDRVPLLSHAAVQSAAGRLEADIPAVKGFDFKQVVDMGAVRRLIGEGYFQKLFGAGVRDEEERKLKASY